MEPSTEPGGPQLPTHPPQVAPHPAALSPLIWEVPRSYRADMRVPARIFADELLLEKIRADRSLAQLVNVTTLPGIVDAAYGMPDMHEGYGFPVGGVAATALPDGVISPGGIGYDINCGVRLMASPLSLAEAEPLLPALVHELSRSVPAGFGRVSRRLSLTIDELCEVVEQGVPWLVRKRGLGLPEDASRIEGGGCLPRASADALSARALQRGHDQLGTLGGGNHFLELQLVEQLFDEATAARLGLFLKQVVVMIHTGSRGLGHQTATDFVRLLDASMHRHEITVPDRQLACAPLSSPEGQRYFSAMCAAANFGFCNRQVIAQLTREVFSRVAGLPLTSLRLVYDVAHNTAKLERHGGRELCVHRKGATRAFGPSHPEIPAEYRGVGQPVFIPGSMGTASHVLVGTDEAEALSFGSCCHGAGRALSRGAAKHQVVGAQLRRELEGRGIVIRCPSNQELAEEAPLAYKDVDRVVDVVHRAGLARKVARLSPLGVLKG